MVTALNVANNILQRAFKADIDITPMKLQKMIYFVYKEYYKETGAPLFNERFEVWQYGPVLPSVYQMFKHRKANAIKEYALDEELRAMGVDESSNQWFKNAIDTVWLKYGNYDGIVLSKLTHAENGAWMKAYKRGDLYLSDSDIKVEEELSFG